MIEADKRLPTRLALDPHESGGQLERIRRPQGMPVEGARRVLPNGLAREHFGPGRRKAGQDGACLLFVGRVEEPFPSEPCESGPAFHHAAPPHDHEAILRQDLPEKRTPGLFQAERNDGGRIPEFHRPVSRSSPSACRPSPWASCGRGSVQTASGTRPEPCATSPACSKAASEGGRAMGSPANGTIFAIGVPRSVTTTSSPALTQAKHARRAAFNWEMDAVRIESPSRLCSVSPAPVAFSTLRPSPSPRALACETTSACMRGVLVCRRGSVWLASLVFWVPYRSASACRFGDC